MRRDPGDEFQITHIVSRQHYRILWSSFDMFFPHVLYGFDCFQSSIL